MKDEQFFNEINDNISVVEGNKKELFIFTNSKDTLSFLGLLQLNKQTNNRKLTTLNSCSNNGNDFLNQIRISHT